MLSEYHADCRHWLPRRWPWGFGEAARRQPRGMRGSRILKDEAWHGREGLAVVAKA
jgi:hypothetical protein